MEVIISGLPGKMAQAVVSVFAAESIPMQSFSFASSRHAGEECVIAGQKFTLIAPQDRTGAISKLKQSGKAAIVIDYTKPDTALSNVEFYCNAGLPFIMGTSGFDKKEAEKIVARSKVSAVIAVAMAPQLVLLQSMFEMAAQQFPGALDGYSLTLTESHQKAKVDKSGIGTSISKYLQTLGAEFPAEKFISIREPEQQKKMGIPDEAIGGHAYHTYELRAADGSSEVVLTHNVRGRASYARGTIPAFHFLTRQIKNGVVGKVFSMQDVLHKA